MKIDRNLKIAAINFPNFVVFIIQISFTDYIKANYSIITFQNLEEHIVKVIVIHFSRIPFVVVGLSNSQVMLILEADLQK